MSHSLFDLSGRTALVTGGASGIGRQTVHMLAELGAIVYARYRHLTFYQETQHE